MAEISIHTSLTGSDDIPPNTKYHRSLFQSTLPSREVTYSGRGQDLVRLFQSTLPSREVTTDKIPFIIGDLFQSTLPSREVTNNIFLIRIRFTISIHTSLTGSDRDAERV